MLCDPLLAHYVQSGLQLIVSVQKAGILMDRVRGLLKIIAFLFYFFLCEAFKDGCRGIRPLTSVSLITAGMDFVILLRFFSQ